MTNGGCASLPVRTQPLQYTTTPGVQGCATPPNRCRPCGTPLPASCLLCLALIKPCQSSLQFSSLSIRQADSLLLTTLPAPRWCTCIGFCFCLSPPPGRQQGRLLTLFSLFSSASQSALSRVCVSQCGCKFAASGPMIAFFDKAPLNLQ